MSRCLVPCLAAAAMVPTVREHRRRSLSCVSTEGYTQYSSLADLSKHVENLQGVGNYYFNKERPESSYPALGIVSLSHARCLHGVLTTTLQMLCMDG